MTKVCTQCKTENPDDSDFCKNCGTNLKNVSAAKKSSRSGPGGWWGEQTNLVKALSIIGVCCLGIIIIFGISAILSPDSNTSTTTTTPTTTTTTPTDSAEMSESEYLDKAQLWSKDIKDTLDDITYTAENYATLSDSTIISMLESDQATVKKVIREMESITPPSKFASVHATTLSAYRDIDQALTYEIRGVENVNADDIEQATSYIQSATSKITQATNEIENM
ncbi:hypothetical protein FGU46_10295 [Methanobacterium sp. CWC-01]|uniref:zinc ribbon domain-containing protein n=1 Tax=Methanobacterium aridiramus TaxID=2584467 RepID=UPI002577A97F|nr:zinc ribbon domain-containing protein [Methanobacterium sp. CWC-01]WJI10449.1 hypothetical protein FGU46_10295 [Methanobacterium sp. CWC-01]